MVLISKKAGGAPANVAAAITKLDGHATFMGQVGNDPFGDFLEQTLQRAHVDTSMLIKDKQTTLAFVSIDKDGERDFIFMRGADGQYTFNKINLAKIKSNDLIHFGSATALLSSPFKRNITFNYYNMQKTIITLFLLIQIIEMHLLQM